MIELSKIRIDGGTQPRAELNQATVDEYAEAIKAGAVLPPVTLFFDGSDFWLADGFHRYFGAKAAGRTTIHEDITPGTLRDAILYSLSANSKHGLRRSNADKRRAVETLLADAEWRENTDSWIAEKAGVGRVFVVAVRKESILSSDNKKEKPKEQLVTVTRNGKTYQMNVASIGESKAKQRPLTDKEERIVRRVHGSCVYLLSANDRVKVGWTRHGARSRVENLLRSTPMSTVIAVANGGNKEERAVHKILECERDAGEWFVCSVDQAIEAMRTVGLNPLFDPEDEPSEPAEPAPPEYTPLDAANDQISDLQDALALAAAGDLSPEDKEQAAGLIARLREEIRVLTATLKAVTASRDHYQAENGELKHQIRLQRREIDKLAGTRTA